LSGKDGSTTTTGDRAVFIGPLATNAQLSPLRFASTATRMLSSFIIVTGRAPCH
jgi:hypothetical protein